MSQEQAENHSRFRFTPRVVGVSTLVLISASLLIVATGPATAAGWFVLVGVFGATYAMLAKSRAAHYPPEGRKPMAMWPSDIPPQPPQGG
jgi:hypothetical protein